MKFNLANKAPINVVIDGTEYALKRFVRKDWIEWAAEIDAERARQATDSLDPVQRSRLLLIYAIEPTSHADLSRRVNTPDGTGRIIRTCAKKSGVPDSMIESLLTEGDERDLETLALMLASIVDPSEIKPPSDGEKDAAGDDPLPSSGKGSNA